ncbi:MAG: YbgA family protein [Pseudomonadota bacterium]|nr:YbgA family protein [Pseudomonadota bacterium]
MSHDQLDYQKLGVMIAATTKRDAKEQALSYFSEFMNSLKISATRQKHVNVYQHLSGYLQTHPDKDDKRELIQVIETYRTGMVF